jgi:hypothetical protein
MPGRVVGEVASDLEQKRNDIVGDVENTLHVHAEKGPERGRHQGDAGGCTRAMCGASRDTGGPSLSRLAPPSQLLALHQLPQRTPVLCANGAAATEASEWRTTDQATAPGACACCGEDRDDLESRTRHERRSIHPGHGRAL